MAWFNTSYLSKKALTMDHTKVSGGSDLSSFPVLVSMTDANLKTAANGGLVQNSNGFDIIFVDSTETTPLNFEIESYTASSGAIVMWVNIPTLSASSDTIIYMYFNNASISTSQANPTAVWDSNYVGVWHLKESTGSNPADSTSNAITATQNNSPTQGAGQIDGSLSFNGSTQYLDLGNPSVLRPSSFPVTMSAWVKVSSLAAIDAIFTNNKTGNTTHSGIWMQVDTNGKIEIDYGDNGGSASSNRRTKVGTTVLSTGTWYYVVGVLRGATDMTIYVNGTDDGGTFSGTGGSLTYNTSLHGNIARIGDDPSGFFFMNGVLDDVRFSKNERVAGWVTTEYNNQNNPGTFFSVGSLTNFYSVASESVSLSDLLSQSGSDSFTDSASLSDTQSSSGSNTPTSETVSLSDVQALSGSNSPSAESVSLVEMLTSLTGSAQITDSAQLADLTSLSGAGVIATENVSLSDSQSQSGGVQPTDSVSLTEQDSLSGSNSPTAENALLSDVTSQSGSSSFTDSASLSDGQSQSGASSSSESLALSDIESQSGSNTLTSESVTLSDSSLFSGSAQIVEIALLSDTQSLSGTNSPIAETVTLSDLLSLLGLLSETDSVSLSDLIALSTAAFLIIAPDSVSLSDLLSQSGSGQLTESAQLGDSYSSSGSSSLTDSAQLSDQSSLSGSETISAENVSLADSASLTGLPSLTDSVQLSDSESQSGSNQLSAESAQLSEILSLTGLPQIVESVTLSDLQTLLGALLETDSVSLSDVVVVSTGETTTLVIPPDNVQLSENIILSGNAQTIDSVSLDELISLVSHIIPSTNATFYVRKGNVTLYVRNGNATFYIRKGNATFYVRG